MEQKISKIIGVSALVFIYLFLFNFSSAIAMVDSEGENNISQGKNITSKNTPGAQGASYVPARVLVKFKEDADPKTILESLGISTPEIARIYSIAPAAAKFKKEHKLEKTSDGWYDFLGKKYEEVDQIPDEEAFKQAYPSLSTQEKGLYQTYKIQLPENVSVEEAVAKLKANPAVEYAQPDYIVKIAGFPQDLPNDTYVDPLQTNTWTTGSFHQPYEDLWGLKNIKADKIWQTTQGEGVVVAVADSGVDYNHPDLWDNIWVNPAVISDSNGDGKTDLNDCDLNHDHSIESNEIVDNMFGWDFANNDNNPMDGNGHGTHCAGTISAVGNNALGVIGVAPKARIMAVKGLSDQGSGAISDLAQCVKYAADYGAQVISNSWGGPSPVPDPVLQDAFDYANAPDNTRSGNNKQGCVTVVAAGNDNMDFSLFTPANLAGVISVAAIDNTDAKASFSNWGKVDIAAPGVNILSTMPDNSTIASMILTKRPDLKAASGYYALSGTSMACPHAAGAAALLLFLHPDYDPQDVRLALKYTVRELPVLVQNFTPGFGVIDVDRALRGGSNPIVVLKNCQFVDTGNRDGELEPGETVNLIVELKALNQDASNIDIELRSSDPYVNILKGGSRYSVILKGKTESNKADPFSFRIANDCPLGRTLDFSLTIYLGNGTIRRERLSVEVVCATDMKWVRKFEGINAGGYPPIVEDIDKDEKQEVIFILPGGAYGESQGGKIYVVRSDGSDKSDWPVVPEPGQYNRLVSLAVGDIDNNGYSEIVVTMGKPKIVNGFPMNESSLYAYKDDGKPLPGFPIKLAVDQYETGTVSLADINADGYLDIVVTFGESTLSGKVFTNAKYLAAYNYQGKLLKKQKLEKQNFGGYLTLGDTGNDNLPETVLGSNADGNAGSLGGLWLYNSNFSRISGWPADTDVSFQISPTTMGDLYHNKSKEIVGYSPSSSVGGVYIFNSLGKQLSYSSQAGNGYSASEPILVDLDRDDDLEILAKGLSDIVYAYHHDGSPVTGWEFPAVPEFSMSSGEGSSCQLIAGDIDADGYPEILLMTNDSSARVALNAWNGDGTVVSGFPRVYSKNYIGLCPGGIAIADLDGNGSVEIVYLGSDSYDGISRMTYLGILELPGPYQKDKMEWPMYRHDPQRTGCYTPAGTGPQLLPVKPVSLIATVVSSSQINLSWTDKSINEQEFKIERSANGVNFTQISKVGANVANYQNTGLTAATRYYYRVRASNMNGDSGYTNTVSATTLQNAPSAPTNLTATAVSGSNTKLTLSWTDNSANEQGFKIQHSTNGTTFTQLATVAAKTGSGTQVIYAHNALIPGSIHYYKVLAYNTAGNSVSSNIAQITMPAKNPPQAPTNLTATAVSGSNTKLILAWTDNATNETSFKVQHSTNGTTFTQLATVVAKTGSGGAVTYAHNGLVPSSTHYYKVTAYNVDGDSTPSNIAQITMPPKNPPQSPTNLTATAVSHTKTTLSWTDNATNEQGFKIQHSTNGTTFTQLATVTAKTGSGGTVIYAHANLIPGSIHYYKVLAYNVDGNSAFSNVASATTAAK
ncbi:MAG: S8 family serine peptidase [Candidatus Omnitrophota bacterium]